MFSKLSYKTSLGDVTERFFLPPSYLNHLILDQLSQRCFALHIGFKVDSKIILKMN